MTYTDPMRILRTYHAAMRMPRLTLKRQAAAAFVRLLPMWCVPIP